MNKPYLRSLTNLTQPEYFNAGTKGRLFRPIESLIRQPSEPSAEIAFSLDAIEAHLTPIAEGHLLALTT